MLHLVQQVRDETHRFAVTFHRQRRARRDLRSELVEIPGVGEKTAQKLLARFGSLERIRRLSAEQLASAVPRRQAERIVAGLRAATRS